MQAGQYATQITIATCTVHTEKKRGGETLRDIASGEKKDATFLSALSECSIFNVGGIIS